MPGEPGLGAVLRSVLFSLVLLLGVPAAFLLGSMRAPVADPFDPREAALDCGPATRAEMVFLSGAPP